MKIAICDDEEKVLEEYQRMIEELMKEHQDEIQIYPYVSGQQLLFDIEDTKTELDLIILDIHMPEIDGVTVAEKIRALGYCNDIVFLTVSQEHWQNAFDLEARNYLVKGEVNPERFKKLLEKSYQDAANRQKEYLIITSGGAHYQIEIGSIQYFELVNRIVNVHYNDESLEFISNLNKIEERLYGMGFFRVHRSYLVAVNRIEMLSYHNQGELTMKDGTIIPVGRKQYGQLKELLSKRTVG